MAFLFFMSRLGRLKIAILGIWDISECFKKGSAFYLIGPRGDLMTPAGFIGWEITLDFDAFDPLMAYDFNGLRLGPDKNHPKSRKQCG